MPGLMKKLKKGRRGAKMKSRYSEAKFGDYGYSKSGRPLKKSGKVDKRARIGGYQPGPEKTPTGRPSRLKKRASGTSGWYDYISTKKGQKWYKKHLKELRSKRKAAKGAKNKKMSTRQMIRKTQALRV